MIKFTVKDRQGEERIVELTKMPEYNVMEILKSDGYKMRATCGGMGLCADCLCRIKDPNNLIPEPTEQELDTLDSIPDVYYDSRLCCQIKPGEYLNDIHLALSGVDQ